MLIPPLQFYQLAEYVPRCTEAGLVAHRGLRHFILSDRTYHMMENMAAVQKTEFVNQTLHYLHPCKSNRNEL